MVLDLRIIEQDPLIKANNGYIEALHEEIEIMEKEERWYRLINTDLVVITMFIVGTVAIILLVY